MARNKGEAKRLLGLGPVASSADPVDPYLPQNGNRGYRVSRYELTLEYKVSSNRLSGRAEITAATLVPITRFSLDMAAALTAAKVTVNGHRAARFVQRGNKLTITTATEVPAGAALLISVRYAGTPRPIRSLWGEVGWEELSEGVLVAAQPNGAASWFPCDDHPSSKASYRISLTTDSPYRVVANGNLVSSKQSAGHTTWVFDQPYPMPTYLATVQIGPYELRKIAEKPVPIRAVLPPRLSRNFDIDFGRQALIMRSFVDWFGPYPFDQYTVVVTDDPLEIPIEALGISTFGANHCDGTRRDERLVAHELAHQWFGNSLTITQWKDIWLHEGFACYAEWLWSQESGGPTTQAMVERYYRRLTASPKDIVIGDPGPKSMFDDRVYKRGAITVHALRVAIGDANFFALLRDWTSTYQHQSVTTDMLIILAAKHSPHPLRDLWQAWLYDTHLPPLPR